MTRDARRGAARDHARRCSCRPMPRASSRWPTSADADELFWVDPQRRGVLPLDGLHVSRRLARSFLRGGFEIRRRRRLRRRASPPAPTGRRPGSTPRSRGSTATCTAWATRIRSRSGTTARSPAGSTAWRSARPSSARACSAARRDASKFALIALVARLRAGGFRLLDTQFVTDAPRAPRRRRDQPRRLSPPARGGGEPARATSWRCRADASRQRLLQLTHPDVVARVVERRQRRRRGEHPAGEPRRVLADVADAQERVGVGLSGRPRGTRQASAVISRCPKRTVSPTAMSMSSAVPFSVSSPRRCSTRRLARVAWLFDDLHRLRRHRLHRRRAPARRRATRPRDHLPVPKRIRRLSRLTEPWVFTISSPAASMNSEAPGRDLEERAAEQALGGDLHVRILRDLQGAVAR